jgi:hypothetical protein
MKKQTGNRLETNQETVPIFEAADGKILATGDMFRGPHTGFASDFDLNNPGRNLAKEDFEEDLR